MKLRIIDYIGNDGGGVRFTLELVRALKASVSDFDIEFVSAGSGLSTYEGLFAKERLDCRVRSIPPLQSSSKWRFDVPPEALADCDIAWFPWVHRHRLPAVNAAHVVGSFHDAIIFTDASVARIYGAYIPDERQTIEAWLESKAIIVVTSHATLATMRDLFGVSASRFEIVPVSGAHVPDAALHGPLPDDYSWTQKPFILTAANISPHKNHEVLLRGVSGWGRAPLVLTGGGTDLRLSSHRWLKRLMGRYLSALRLVRRPRALFLKDLARSLGFVLDKTLFPLGYIPNEIYYPLLGRAWAVVMPTMAEGGGSFPVEEAIWAGVPVICSDIPVIREHVDRVGAHVQWFDPTSAADLTAKLTALANDYPTFKARAQMQIASLARRSWRDAAAEYLSIFSTVSRAACRPRGSHD